MDKITLTKSVRQLCQSARMKLDVMVKPEVVIKEYNDGLESLKRMVDETQCRMTDKAKMYEIIRKSKEFQSICRRDAYALRGRLLRIENALPSLLTLSKGKLV